MNKKLGLLFDKRFFEHRIASFSLENPARLRHLYMILEERFLTGNFIKIPPREASVADIEAVHSHFYREQLREHAVREDPFSYDKDTYLMAETLPTARLAAGGCLELADRIMEGEIDCGLALIRPPGHHAEPGRGMGFCVFNNVAITAAWLQRRWQLKRILILDFDIHHGNGTQEAFYDSREVLFLSLHQSNLFPYTGCIDELGLGDGRGYTINVPVYPQFGDLEYTCLLGHLLQTLTEQYQPQIILVSAGFDGHRDETISSTLLSSEWFGTAARLLRQCACEVCDGRLLFILEGGYNPVSLEQSLLATIDSLISSGNSQIGIFPARRAEKLLFTHPLQEFWSL